LAKRNEAQREGSARCKKKCKIKGTFNNKDRKIYHLQDQKFYALVSVDEAKKRWFLTDQHDDEAPIHAVMRIDELLDEGGVDGTR